MSGGIGIGGPGRQRGMSLVELMVAMAVGLLLLGGVIQVYVNSKQSYDAQGQLARIQESGRFAMDLITRDLRRAGYWGGNADTAANAGAPGPFAPAHTCAANDQWGRMIQWRVSGLNNTDTGYTCATGYLPNTDILTVRYAGPEVIADDDVPSNDGLYLRATMFQGWLMSGALKNDPQNTPPLDVQDGPAHLRAAVRPLVAHAYYVGDSGRTCPGGAAAIPALHRVSLNPADGTPQVQEVASGVEQLQLRYLVGDAYVDADAVADWRDVMAVRVWLLVRGECPEVGFVNQNTYAMGDVTVPNAPDNFRRQLYVSTVMLRNNVVR